MLHVQITSYLINTHNDNAGVLCYEKLITHRLHLLFGLGLVFADVGEGHAVPLLHPTNNLLVQAKEDVRLHLQQNLIHREIKIQRFQFQKK